MNIANPTLGAALILMATFSPASSGQTGYVEESPTFRLTDQPTSASDIAAGRDNGLIHPVQPSLLSSDETEVENQLQADTKAIEEAAAARKKKFAGAYKPLFYDNDFSFLADCENEDCWLGDRFKYRCVGGRVRVSVGGQYRFRFQSEQNMRGLGLTGVDDDFGLHRTRLFADARFSPRLCQKSGVVRLIREMRNCDFPPSLKPRMVQWLAIFSRTNNGI